MSILDNPLTFNSIHQLGGLLMRSRVAFLIILVLTSG